MSEDIEACWDRADELYHGGHRQEAIAALRKIIQIDVDAEHFEGIRCKELAILRLGEILCAERQSSELINLLRLIRPFFSQLPKAKATKIVRRLFDHTLHAGATPQEQEAICTETIEWAREEKRTFLRHRLEHRLAEFYFDQGSFQQALDVVNALLREVRRLDDRSLLVDIHLLESKVYYAIRNVSKSRAALVSARTNASAIYCAPLAQAEIDLQSGILHAEEKDARTAFSYLYEAFEGFHQLGDHARQARQALRYMILAKISTDTPDELRAVLQTKSVMEYRGRDMEALQGIAEGYRKKDTHQFNQVMTEYHKDLAGDATLHKHLTEMLDTLIEKHLLRIIEPYNRVQVSYLAELLKLPQEDVEARLSQLILDKKLRGIVDQRHNCLVLFEEVEERTKGAHLTLFHSALNVIQNTDKLTTALFDKVAGKFDSLVEENFNKSREGEGKKNAAKKGEKDNKGADKKSEGKSSL